MRYCKCSPEVWIWRLIKGGVKISRTIAKTQTSTASPVLTMACGRAGITFFNFCKLMSQWQKYHKLGAISEKWANEPILTTWNDDDALRLCRKSFSHAVWIPDVTASLPSPPCHCRGPSAYFFSPVFCDALSTLVSQWWSNSKKSAAGPALSSFFFFKKRKV